jgi:hypothetical protein
VLAPVAVEPVSLHRRYRADDFRELSARGEVAVLVVNDRCDPDELLVVADLMPGLNAPFQVAPLEHAPLPAPVARTWIGRYFACPTSGMFSLRVTSLDPDSTDVFVLRHSLPELAPPGAFAQQR